MKKFKKEIVLDYELYREELSKEYFKGRREGFKETVDFISRHYSNTFNRDQINEIIHSIKNHLFED